MDLHELIFKRRSVRNFQDRSVPPAIIDELLDAAASAPSGGNIQPLSIIVVEQAERRRQLAEIVGRQPWVANAPVTMVFCLDFSRPRRWAALYDVTYRGQESLAFFLIAYADLMCAAQTVTLLAEERGLGSVYVGTIQSNLSAARQLLKIPEGVLPLILLTLGYPKTIPSGIPKLNRDMIAHREEYRVPSDEEIRMALETKYGILDEDVDRYLERAYVEVLEADRQADTDWVRAVKKEMQSLEIKSNAEFLFKLRYPSDRFVQLNESIATAMREAGFDCFPDR